MKGKDEEIEDLYNSKKKSSKEVESLQALIDELRANNGKLEKSKKRLQEEVISCFPRRLMQTSSQQVVFALFVLSFRQVVPNLLTTCNNKLSCQLKY